MKFEKKRDLQSCNSRCCCCCSAQHTSKRLARALCKNNKNTRSEQEKNRNSTNVISGELIGERASKRVAERERALSREWGKSEGGFIFRSDVKLCRKRSFTYTHTHIERAHTSISLSFTICVSFARSLNPCRKAGRQAAVE
jgi:hypothetical protein